VRPLALRFRLVAIVGMLAILLPAVSFHTAIRAAADGSTRQLVSGGTSTFRSNPAGSTEFGGPEFPKGVAGANGSNPVNRSHSHGHGKKGEPLFAPVVPSSTVDGTTPGLVTSVDGLRFRDQRLANGGNQFSVEPPDQGLCAGNGFVLETVNTVMRVYGTTGTPVSGTMDLNTFYGYPAEFNRTTGLQGPFVTDPSCYFDTDTQRWFHVALTLEVDPSTGNFLGPNHLDIAVSQTSSPLGTWTIYRLPVQDDGTQGTPNHGCSLGPCLGDYPHIGADANGFYITTNEYSFFGPEFKSAQIYAMSKRALAAGVANPTVVQFGNTSTGKTDSPGFTVWPATAPNGQNTTNNGGTEFFLSTLAALETGNTTGFANSLGVWALTNTASLDSSSPDLTLSSSTVSSETYGIPPASDQKPGSVPLIDCLNDTSCSTFLLGAPDPFIEAQGPLDSNDTRMQQVVYANGLLWGSLDTVVTVAGQDKAGVAWFAVRPVVIGNGKHVGPQSAVVSQGYVGVANNNVIYPAITMRSNGTGVMAFTLVGADYYPSAAYAVVNAASGLGNIHVAKAGLGPQDGFSETHVFSPNADGTPRPRWGDYGAAVVDGSTIWIASEYIGQTCTFQQYLTNTAASPLFSCSRTRTSLGNWYTRISQLTR
jgi:hypothetical protein